MSKAVLASFLIVLLAASAHVEGVAYANVTIVPVYIHKKLFENVSYKGAWVTGAAVY